MTTCIIPRPTPQELFDRIKNQFSATVLGGAQVIPETPEWYVVSNDYFSAETFHALMRQQFAEMDPRTACCDSLVAMATRDGVIPRAASYASGYVTISGAIGAAMPTAPEFTLAGKSFVAADPSVIPATMPSPGTFLTRIQAVEAGVAGNVTIAGNATATLNAPPSGINSALKVAGNITCGGRAAETCEELRTRYIDRLTYKPDFMFDRLSSWALEWPCATRVCLRMCCIDETADECGSKPVELHVLFDNTFENGIAPSTVIAEIDEYLFGSPKGLGLGRAPIGICGTVYPVKAAFVSLQIAGMACVPIAQQDIVKTRMYDYFKRLCPSVTVCERTIFGIVAQVIGEACTIEISFSTTETDPDVLSISECGDIVSGCDVLPVLSEVTFG